MSIGQIRGVGVRARHARGCASRNGFKCSCDPSFEAWVWLSSKQKKVYKTFRSETAARKWRIGRLEVLYGQKRERGGKLDRGYGFLRQACQEYDRVMRDIEPPARAYVREAYEALIHAEDATLRALVEGE